MCKASIFLTNTKHYHLVSGISAESLDLPFSVSQAVSSGVFIKQPEGGGERKKVGSDFYSKKTDILNRCKVI